MSSRRQQRQAMAAAEETGTDPWILASAASVVLSLFMFFVARDREMGIFVGLWPPTFLAFASYFQQTRMHDMMERAMGGSGMIERVEKIVQGR